MASNILDTIEMIHTGKSMCKSILCYPCYDFTNGLMPKSSTTMAQQYDALSVTNQIICFDEILFLNFLLCCSRINCSSISVAFSNCLEESANIPNYCGTMAYWRAMSS